MEMKAISHVVQFGVLDHKERSRSVRWAAAAPVAEIALFVSRATQV